MRLEMSSTVTVIGANGRTGRKLVNFSLRKGWKVNAVTRTGYKVEDYSINTKNFANITADITSQESLQTIAPALQLSKACIFAASASKEGGSATAVDKDGLINIAKLSIANKVPRLVVISSGAVTKPLSPVFLFLNLFGGIMQAKFEGENELKRLYNSPEAKSARLSYTIIRPGGLTEEPPRGCGDIALNQGDNKSGRISRWDVASIALESIDDDDAANTTFEAYYKETAQRLANVGLSNLFKWTKKSTEEEGQVDVTERTGSTWKLLFKGLAKDL